MRIKNNNDNFESVEEFIDFLNRGGEVEFRFNHRIYSITHGNKNFYFIEQYNLLSEQVFSSIDELLDYKIENHKMYDIITVIEPFFRTF